MPLSVLVALQGHTHLWVWPGSHRSVWRFVCGGDSASPRHPHEALRVRIPPGWACFFRTDLVHAGAGNHATTHARFHCYADLRGARPGHPLLRAFDATGLVPGYGAENHYVFPRETAADGIRSH